MNFKQEKSYILRVEGLPRAKPRMSHKDRWLPSKAVQRYWAWANLVRIAGRKVWRAPFVGPVIIEARFFLPIPTSCSRNERVRRLGTTHVQKPDIKNLVAGLEDALNKIAWMDDSQIIGYRNCFKYWGSGAGLTTLQVYLAVNCEDSDRSMMGEDDSVKKEIITGR